MFNLNTPWGVVDKLFGITGKPIDAPLWFVRDLFLIFLAMPILVILLKRVKWILIIAMISLILTPDFIYENWYSVVCFLLGLEMSRRKVNLHNIECYRWAILPIWVIFSMFVYWTMVYFDLNHADPRVLIWYYILSIPAWLGIARWTDFSSDGIFARIILPATFFIYCSHFLICSTCLHVLASRVPTSSFQLMLLYCIFIGLGGGLILFIFHVSRSICPKILSIFQGGRIA